MKIRSLALLSCLAFACCSLPLMAADASNAASDLSALVSKVKERLQEGKKTEPELAAELKEFDALIDKYKGDKSDAAAEIVLMKAMLYLEVLNQNDQGTQLLEQLKRDYPDTKPGKNADTILQHMKELQASKDIQRTLTPGAKFPDFDEKDVAGNPISVARLKGKLVLIDFWATWCGPCVFELPNVQKVYDKYHDKGFEIIGISLDKSVDTLKTFTKDKGIPWPQFCDGKFWDNKLAKQYGIQSIPAAFLLDRDGKIIGKDLRGDDIEQAVAKALAQK